MDFKAHHPCRQPRVRVALGDLPRLDACLFGEVDIQRVSFRVVDERESYFGIAFAGVEQGPFG